jgi:hypothetical protein
MPEPAWGVYSPPSVSGIAIQFDGSMPSLLEVFSRTTANTDGAFVSVSFGPTNVIKSVTFGGPVLNFTMISSDWVIIPDNGSLFVVDDATYQACWEPIDAPQ